MEKTLASNAYLKLDIVTGRLYRCMTSMLQDFIEVQFSAIYGDRWMEMLLKAAADAVSRPDAGAGTKTMLNQLLLKKEEYGIEVMNKHHLDVSVINTISLYCCFYVVCVPKFKMPKDKILTILPDLQNAESNGYNDLVKVLDERIAKRPKLIIDCQKQLVNKANGSNVDLIKDLSFTKHIKRIVNDKNRLNSHMSDVTNPLTEDALVSETINDVRTFLRFLNSKWNYDEKESFIEEYNRQLEVIEYLNFSHEFKGVADAVDHIIDGMGERKQAIIKEKADLNEREIVRLLSDAENRKIVGKVLKENSDTNKNVFGYILLAFMQKCGWGDEDNSKELLIRASLIVSAKNWYKMAETNRKYEPERALIYYIGSSMVSGEIDGYYYASYLAVKLKNFELTKKLFFLSRFESDSQMTLAGAFASLSEDTFMQCAENLNGPQFEQLKRQAEQIVSLELKMRR